MGVAVSKDQYKRACSVDLYEFLLQNHPSAVKVEYSSALLLADKHVSVKRGYHGYRNFRTDEKGNNIDYLMNFLGYSYPEAVLALIGESGVGPAYVPIVNPSILETKEIILPKPLDGQYKNLYAYMMARGIPPETIQMLIDKRILYQSEQGNNIVFINPQGDYCEMRGTNSYADRRCAKRKECVRYTSGDHTWCTQMDSCVDYKSDPFHGCKKTRPDRFWYLAGQDCRDRNPDLTYILPKNKDWNDDLKRGDY